uniref:DNA polymerase n=1 Tax=uncultured marine group II/III euryarchaeote KM3_185_F04 TaxID=1457949 RepID=A0A075GUW8_9EURY|nr:DNA polymerase family B (DPA, polB1) [uncultured marine group II/III euryarchaeote KM3_185_F04]
MQWEEEMCIISGSYRSGEGKPPRTTVELWCRARSGHSVTLLVNGLRPYVVIALPGKPRPASEANSALDYLRSRDWAVNVSPIGDKWTQDGIKPHWKVEVPQPWMITSGPNIRKILKESWEVSSADILFERRLLLDYDLGPHISACGEVLWAGERAPIEVRDDDTGDRTVAAGRIAEAGGSGLYPTDMVVSCTLEDLAKVDPFRTPFVSFSFDLETSIQSNRILCAAAIIDRGGERSEHTFQGDEGDIMEGLTSLVHSEDPDIITGYNIDNFDLPRMEERADVLAGRSKMEATTLFGWGRVPMLQSEAKPRRLFPSRRQNRVWDIAGRIPLDAWWQARQTLRPQRESLSYVSKLLWPEDEDKHKLDIDASQMDREWAERPEEVLEYCVRDTILPLDILDRLQSVARKEALASVSLTTVETASTGTTSQWIDSLVIRLADRSDVAVPTTISGPRRRDQIAGGYVHEVDAGISPWVVVLDFKSMYPSIMIANNICSTTLVRDDTTDDSYSVSPTTQTRYLSKENRVGLVPHLLEQLMQSRDRHKAALAEARAAGDEAEAFLQDQLQYAVKILMNSFYGVFASSFYRFTHPDLGASITEWARHNIRGIIAQVEEDGHEVVYSDTDSIFVRSPVDKQAPIKRPEDEDESLSEWEGAKRDALQFGERLADRFTREGAELEFETALSAFFSHGAKKRYVGRVVWPREEMLIRGYEVRRTDSFALLTRTMTDMFEMILDGEEWAAVEMTKSVIDDVKARRTDVADLVISRSCKGTLRRDGSVDFTKVYDNPDGLPYVRAAKERIRRGLPFTPGMKVGYIVTNAKMSPMTVEPWLVDEIGEKAPKYDPDYYARRLAKSLGRITEAFGWSETELLSGSRQQSIFDF